MKAHILIVEDNQIECLRLSKILEMGGFIPIVTHNGFSALDACEKYTIDAALVDIQMPHMDGFSFLERLGRVKERHTFPVIMMTASRHDTKHVKEAVQLGARDFIIKPTDAQMLISKLTSIFKNKSDWGERIVNPTQMQTQAQIGLTISVYSISEMGVRIISSMPMETNRFIELNWPVFIENGVGPVNLKVIDCEPVENGHSIYLSFLGLPEHQLQKLRQLCMRVNANQRFPETTKNPEKES